MDHSSFCHILSSRSVIHLGFYNFIISRIQWVEPVQPSNLSYCLNNGRYLHHWFYCFKHTITLHLAILAIPNHCIIKWLYSLFRTIVAHGSCCVVFFIIYNNSYHCYLFIQFSNSIFELTSYHSIDTCHSCCFSVILYTETDCCLSYYLTPLSSSYSCYFLNKISGHSCKLL